MGVLKTTVTVTLALAALLWSGVTHAQQRPKEQAVVFFGYDTTGDDHYGYAGASIAPFGSIHEQGWRIRVFGFGAGFEYAGPGGRTTNATGGGGSASIGYDWRFDGLRITTYVGGAARHFDTSPENPSSSLEDENVGLPVQVESNYRLSQQLGINVIGLYTFFYDTYWTRVRPTIWLAWRDLRAGPEFTFLGGDEWDRQRYGAFVSGFQVGRLNIGLKGGVEYDSREHETGGYGGIEMSFTF